VNPRAANTCWIATVAAVLISAAGCEDSRVPAAGGAPSDRTSTSATQQDDASAAAPGAATIAAEAPTPAASASPQNITFDTLKFPLEKNADYKRSLLTPDIEGLHGRAVRLRGFILPSFQQSGLTQFVLVRDNMQCCFGPGAALYDCVVVEMKPGKSTDFTVRPVAVEGTFEIRDFLGPDGKNLAIYHLDGEAVRF